MYRLTGRTGCSQPVIVWCGRVPYYHSFRDFFFRTATSNGAFPEPTSPSRFFPCTGGTIFVRVRAFVWCRNTPALRLVLPLSGVCPVFFEAFLTRAPGFLFRRLCDRRKNDWGIYIIVRCIRLYVFIGVNELWGDDRFDAHWGLCTTASAGRARVFLEQFKKKAISLRIIPSYAIIPKIYSRVFFFP